MPERYPFFDFSGIRFIQFSRQAKNFLHKGLLMKYDRCLSKGTIIPLLFMVLLSPAGCSGDSGNGSEPIPDAVALDIPALYSRVDTISVLVIYEPDAEPFTGSAQPGTTYWSVLRSNIASLFEGRTIEPDIYVPSDLSEMERISDQGQETWTADDIIALARTVWDGNLSDFAVEFPVFFLNGYFENEEGTNYQIIGVSIIGTPVIAVFKDVVLSSSSMTQVSRFVEQATLVHEFGHVMGLVNNGVPMTSDHLDPEHPRHCTNERCVMFWQNEGASDMMLFVQQMIDEGSVIMFGNECLEDTRSYRP